MAAIKEAEWRAELERLAEVSRAKSAVGLTAAEWARSLGRSINYTRSLLGEAKRLGMLVVDTKSTERLDGKPNSVAVYSIRTQKKVNVSGPMRRAAKRKRGGS